jgi:5-methylcytosine-specific restriction endonuclease McrA
MNLSPKTIRPTPIYSFRPLEFPKLQKAEYPPNWSQWSKWTKKMAGHRCKLCGRGGNQVKLETHHITPVSKGGPTNPRNLMCPCYDCHRLRHPRMWTKHIREHP